MTFGVGQMILIWSRACILTLSIFLAHVCAVHLCFCVVLISSCIKNILEPGKVVFLVPQLTLLTMYLKVPTPLPTSSRRMYKLTSLDLLEVLMSVVEIQHLETFHSLSISTGFSTRRILCIWGHSRWSGCYQFEYNVFLWFQPRWF